MNIKRDCKSMRFCNFRRFADYRALVAAGKLANNDLIVEEQRRKRVVNDNTRALVISYA